MNVGKYMVTAVILCGCNSEKSGSGVGWEKMLPEYTIDISAIGNVSLIEEVLIGSEASRDSAINPKSNKIIAFDLSSKNLIWSSQYFESLEDYRSFSSLRQSFKSINGLYVSRWFKNGDYGIKIIDGAGTTRRRLIAPSSLVRSIPEDIIVTNEMTYIPAAQDIYVYRNSRLLSSEEEIQPEWRRTYESKDRVEGRIDGADSVGRADYDDYARIIYVPVSNNDGRRKVVTLYAYRLDGTEVWRRVIYDQPNAPQTVASPPAYAVAKDGKVVVSLELVGGMHAFDKDGNKLWTKPSYCEGRENIGMSHMDIQNNVLYTAPSGGSCLTAYNMSTGDRRWEFTPPNNQFTFGSRFTIVRGVLYAANGFLWAIEADTGKLLAQSRDFLGAPPDAKWPNTAYLSGGTVNYDAKRDQLLLWAYKLWAFKPVR